MNEVEVTAMNATDLQPMIDALKSAITPQQMIASIAILVGIGIGFVLMWFGVRKCIGIFRNAVMKGKISA